LESIERRLLWVKLNAGGVEIYYCTSGTNEALSFSFSFKFAEVGGGEQLELELAHGRSVFRSFKTFCQNKTDGTMEKARERRLLTS
jgi:hypothetical protein